MRAIAFSMKGSDTIVCAADMVDGATSLIDINSIKFGIENELNHLHIKEFLSTLEAFKQEYSPDIVGVKHRAKYKSNCPSSTGYKIECLIQLVFDNVHIVKPQSITSYLKKSTVSIEGEDTLKKYQLDSFYLLHFIIGKYEKY